MSKKNGFCEICGTGIELEFCCDGFECGCRGYPTNPPACSDICYDKLMEKYKLAKSIKIEAIKKAEVKRWYLAEDDEKSDIIFDFRSNIKMHSEGGTYTSLSAGKETKEQLIKDNEILPDPCNVCGRLVKTHYIEPTRTKLINTNTCFRCDFWNDKLARIDNPRVFIIDGKAYFREDDMDGNNRFVGHGGRQFSIKRLDTGEIIQTKNLWCNGDVPKHFREKMKDNAKFL